LALSFIWEAKQTGMARWLVATLVAAAFGLAFPAAADAGDVAYPKFATRDGVQATAGMPDAISVQAPGGVPSYNIPETLAAPLADPTGPPGNFKHTLWGNEAGPPSRILQYTVIPGVTPGPTCVPAHRAGFPTQQNGRGVAFDPLDGNLWNTTVAQFAGDGYIHKNTPPPVCTPVKDLPFGDGPGGTIQDDIGALDVDEGTKHIWTAGYQPVLVDNVLRSYLYLVNRNNGKILRSCWISFRGGGAGNDTLAVYRNPGLAGSSKYLVTDAGEPTTTPPSYALIDQSDCHGGQQVTPIAEFAKTTPGGVSGIDMEWPGLLSTNERQLYNNGDQPFTTPTLVGNWPNTAFMEDISLCAFRGEFEGAGNDFCPYP
jgi:hypothetical protein